MLELGLPDTLRLTPNGKLLTVGLRVTPAQVAVVDTRTLEYELVRIGPALETNTLAGHQWTSPGVAVIDHRAGNSIVATLGYLGRPHGVDLAADEDDEDEGS